MERRLFYAMILCSVTNILVCQERILGAQVREEEFNQTKTISRFDQIGQDEIVAAHFLGTWIYAKVIVTPTQKMSTCLVSRNQMHSYTNFAIEIKNLRKLSQPDAPASSK